MFYLSVHNMEEQTDISLHMADSSEGSSISNWTVGENKFAKDINSKLE